MSVVDLLSMMLLGWGAGRFVPGILSPLDDKRGLASIPTGSSEIDKKISGNSMEWKGAMSGFRKDTNTGVLSYTPNVKSATKTHPTVVVVVLI
jgi:hypothetical protein